MANIVLFNWNIKFWKGFLLPFFLFTLQMQKIIMPETVIVILKKLKVKCMIGVNKWKILTQSTLWKSMAILKLLRNVVKSTSFNNVPLSSNVITDGLVLVTNSDTKSLKHLGTLYYFQRSVRGHGS